ncbi:MAG: lipopolysaccharide biosynthesis protein [Ruminococcaceae bacterium]|nr:lipopolysaccharide biosynthesis protein [Oscillospiraceae bacterium]
MSDNVKIGKSFAWSSMAEVAAKLITPVTNMILARILAPEAFGVLAVCNMIVSFVEIITDAGFGKFIIQNDFKEDGEKKNYINVAFWSNFVLSAFLWIVLTLSRNFVAEFLGNIEYAQVIPVACLHLIFASMISVQTAVMRREFSFKLLFVIRILTAFVPLIVTVPLALVTRSYWALIIGNVAGAAISCIALFICSKWKPEFKYSFGIMKNMLSYSFWSLCEALAHWTIFWVDVFIIGKIFSDYYLGLYKNSSNMIMSIFNMCVTAITPVLMSALSRLKSDKQKSFEFFLNIEKLLMYFLVPLGIGTFIFRKEVTFILLGEQWAEAADIVGCWAAMMTLSIIFYSMPAEAYKAYGIPKWLFIFQLSYLVVLVPVCILVSNVDYWCFVYARCICIVEQVIMSLIFAHKILKWEIRKFLANMIKPLMASSVVVVLSLILHFENVPILYSIISILIVAIVYVAVLLLLFRKDLMSTIKNINSYKV